MSMPLAALQRSFQARVLAGADDELQCIRSDALADVSARLHVYANAYRLRLLEVLGNDFPGLKALAGAEEFERLCTQYIEANPSRHFNARWYGGALAEFLRSSPAWSARPALGEMAEFEWALTLVFDAEDEPLASEADAAVIAPDAWPGMRPRLVRGLRRIALHWNTTAIRKAAQEGTEVPASSRHDHAQDLLIWRRDRNVHHRPLEPDEAAAIDALGHDASFATLCELLCEWHSEESVAMRAAELLKRWIRDQCLRELAVDA